MVRLCVTTEPPPSPAPAAYSSSPSLTLQMFVRDRRGLQSLSLPASELVVLVSLGLMMMVVMRLRDSLAWLHWEEGGTGGAGAAGTAGPRVSPVHLCPVLSIDPLPAHGGQLAASENISRHENISEPDSISPGQEHDDEGDAGGGDQPTGAADVLVGGGDDQASHHPDDPDGHTEAHHQGDVHGLAVVLPHPSRLQRQHHHHQDEENNVEQPQQLLLEPGGAVEDHLHLVLLHLEVPGDLQDLRGGGDQPLDPDDQLDQDGEAEEEGLVGGGEVDPAVEGDEEDQLDQESGVDEGIS